MRDFTEVQRFRPVLPDSAPQDTVEPQMAKKLYVCTGQLYYELLDRRRQTKRSVRSSNLRILAS